MEIDPIELVSFDDSLIFHHCSQSGKNNTINNFPKELKEQYEERIKHLTEEVLFLRNQLKNSQ